jgi:two-component system chemotaxis response regulator CheB
MAISDEFDAVALGASAGGVEALQTLVRCLRADFGAALLVVLHLPPDRPSALPELLARDCVLPVAEAVDKQPVQPGAVVLAPPNYHLLVEPERTLALSIDPPVLYSRPAIDLLFESAAVAYGPRLLALVLTGASSDGAAGAAAVRRHGGRVWVQDPAEATMPAMPTAALEWAGADEVLGLQEICRRFAGASSTRQNERRDRSA